MGRKMSRDETLKLVCQTLAQALVLLDELGDSISAANVQGVLETIEQRERSATLSKPSHRSSRRETI